LAQLSRLIKNWVHSAILWPNEALGREVVAVASPSGNYELHWPPWKSL